MTLVDLSAVESTRLTREYTDRLFSSRETKERRRKIIATLDTPYPTTVVSKE